MKFWGTILILGWYVARSKAWDDNSPLILNKKGDAYSFPRHVTKDEQTSAIRYRAPEEISDTTTMIFCQSAIDEYKNKNILTGEVLTEAKISTPYNCAEPIKPAMEREEDEIGPVNCGTIDEENGVQYSILFKLAEIEPGEVSTPANVVSLLLYKFCYVENMRQILYAEYTIDNPQLLNNSILQDEQERQFPLVSYNDDAGAIQQLYAQNPFNAPRPVGVTEFMPFAHLRKAFHFYDSTASVNEELLEVWNKLLLKMRSKIAKKTNPIKMFSGTYDRKRVHGTSQYLGSGKIPSPYAWWMLLYDQNQTEGVSLIMHNYAFDVFEHRHELMCQRSVCPEVGLQQSDLLDPLEYKYALVYCCPASAITNLYPFKKVDDNKLFKFNEK